MFVDFARPICLPSSDEFIHMGAACVTLAWNNKGTLKANCEYLLFKCFHPKNYPKPSSYPQLSIFL